MKQTQRTPLLLLLLVAWLSPSEVFGQVAQPPSISVSDYQSIEWEDGESIADLLPLDGSWTAWKQCLGEPTSEACRTDPSGEGCDVVWPGIEATFHDDGSRWYTLRLIIDSARYTLNMDGVEIGIGTSIHDLASVPPVPYAERRVRCISGGCLPRVEFSVGPSTFGMDLVYDPDTEKITQIRVWDIWS